MDLVQAQVAQLNLCPRSKQEKNQAYTRQLNGMGICSCEKTSLMNNERLLISNARVGIWGLDLITIALKAVYIFRVS